MDGQRRSAIFGAATGFDMRAVLLALGLIGAALPAQGAPGDTELVSVTVDGKGAGGWAMGISPDARFVVFTAQSTNVVPGGNPANSLFLKDRLLGTTKIVVPGGGVDFASVSADGRYVAFVCYTSLVPADTNDQADICVRDLHENRTFLASVSSSGGLATSYSDASVISANGRYVVFETESTGLVPGDTNSETDVFVRDIQNGVTERVSVSSSEAQANGGSFNSSISADGRFVVFHSYANNLVAGDTNGESDVFIRDRLAGTTERITVDSSGSQANSYSYVTAGEPNTVSPDGRFVVFISDASNLVDGDTNGEWDVFIRDRQLGLTERVSVSSAGAQTTAISFAGALSSDGRYVAFESTAANLVIGDLNNKDDIFVRDRQTHTTVRASVSSVGVQSDGDSYLAWISADGQSVVFNNTGTNLVDNETSPGVFEVYLHELGGVPRGPPFVVDPEQLDIGSATIWADTARTLTFTNTGSAAISIGALTLKGTDAAQFTAKHSCGSVVPIGGACLITVNLKPTSTGAKTAQLEVAAGNTRQTVELSGNGTLAEFTLTTTAMSFGNQPVDSDSGWRWVQVRNTGPGVLPIKWVGLAGPDASQFDRHRYCPGTLAPGKVCNVPVWFRPTFAGSKSAVLVISPGPSGTLKSVALTGTGI